MDVTYNGVPLDIVQTNGVTRQAIHSDDGVDYHYTFWRFDWTIILNPQTAMALDSRLTFAPGIAAPVADANIRHPLLVPRGKLVVREGNDILLEVPAKGYLTDAANGPFPFAYNIEQVHGDKTNTCRYVIETRMNECAGSAPRPVILSQRWRQTLDVDEDHFAVRTTVGIVVFRSDELLKQNVFPDQLRAQIGHPIPANMRREHVQVAQESDGLTYRYSFVEREQPFTLVNGAAIAATRVEAYETRYIGQPTDFGDIASDTATEVISGASFDLPAFAGRSAAATARGFRRMVPRFYTHVFVRAWGNRASSRINLYRLAMAIVMGRIPELNNPLAFVGQEVTVTHDLMGKFCEVSATIRRGANALTAAFIVAGGNGDFGFPASDLLLTQGGSKLTTQDPAVASPAPPNSSGTRGTHLGVLVAQALGSPCATPPASVNYVLTSGVTDAKQG